MAVNPQVLQTINFEVYEDANRLLGLVTVDLPEIAYRTAEITGAGVLGQIDVPTIGHTDNLEMTLHWRSIFQSPLRLMKNEAVALSLRGAEELYDAGTGKLKVLPVRIDTFCLSTTLTLGKFEPATTTDTETKHNLARISIKIDGVTEFVTDKFNYVHETGGTDYMAGVRTALGL